jgi:hypothetical protein
MRTHSMHPTCEGILESPERLGPVEAAHAARWELLGPESYAGPDERGSACGMPQGAGHRRHGSEQQRIYCDGITRDHTAPTHEQVFLFLSPKKPRAPSARERA